MFQTKMHRILTQIYIQHTQIRKKYSWLNFYSSPYTDFVFEVTEFNQG